MARWKSKKAAEEQLEHLDSQIIEQVETEKTQEADVTPETSAFETVEKALDGVDVDLGETEVEESIREKTEKAIGKVIKPFEGLFSDVNKMKDNQNEFKKKMATLAPKDAAKAVEAEIKKVEALKGKIIEAQQNNNKAVEKSKTKRKPSVTLYWNGMRFS